MYKCKKWRELNKSQFRLVPLVLQWVPGIQCLGPEKEKFLKSEEWSLTKEFKPVLWITKLANSRAESCLDPDLKSSTWPRSTKAMEGYPKTPNLRLYLRNWIKVRRFSSNAVFQWLLAEFNLRNGTLGNNAETRSQMGSKRWEWGQSATNYSNEFKVKRL